VRGGDGRGCTDSNGHECRGLRAAAKRCKDAKQTARILAIAMVLDGFSCEKAARLCGMDRQTLRDTVSG
jgi:hypothetical protein